MKTASTIEKEVENLPEGESFATKNEVISHFDLEKIEEIYSSKGVHEAKSKIKNVVKNAYDIVGGKRDFNNVKSSFKYLYRRLKHLDNLLRSNISELSTYPKSSEEGSDPINMSKGMRKVFGEIKNHEADLGYGRISEGIRYINDENIDFGGQNDIYMNRPGFGPDRKVNSEGKLTKLFKGILKEGVLRELIINFLEAFAYGKPNSSESWATLRCDDNTLYIRNWADNDDRDGREQVKIREPHGNQGFGLYGVRMTATDILQIANSVKYFERPNQSCVEISMRPGWIAGGPA
jgi:hypothetical protein